MKLTSTAFQHGDHIPVRYTCDGDQVSPQLAWSEAPAATKSFVLLMEDPDVPKNLRPDGLFVHWLAWNIPATTTEIPEGQEPIGVVGANTRGEHGYIGPCPPDREHRYFFKLFALDRELTMPSTTTREEILRMIDGHILDQAELMGRYDRPVKQRRGFSFIELIVVIAILGILTSVSLVFNNSVMKPRNRDLQRRQDINAIIRVIELYRADHGKNPIPSYYSIGGSWTGAYNPKVPGNWGTWIASTSAGSYESDMTSYIAAIPNDPLGKTLEPAAGTGYGYRYGFWYNRIAGQDGGYDQGQNCPSLAGALIVSAAFENKPPAGYGLGPGQAPTCTNGSYFNGPVDVPSKKYYRRVWVFTNPN